MKIEQNSDVLLLNIPTSRSASINKSAAQMLSMPPLGLLYIAASLKEHDYRVSFIDLAITAMTAESLIQYLDEIKPKIIGISTYYESWSAMGSLIKLIKRYDERIKIIGGGVCANFCTDALLNELRFDYVSLGEGETSFIEICDMILRKKDVKYCNGLAYIGQEGSVITKKAVRIKEIDKLPVPDRSILNLSRYVYPFTISTARGCPGQCIFCSSHGFWGSKVYFRSTENIIEEIAQIAEAHDAREFFIVDDTFTMIPERTLDFCDKLTSMPYSFVWGCESRADVVTKELLQKMYDSGCRKIQFGLESADDNILKSIKKKVSFRQVEHATQIASEVGFDINISVIIGHAEDTHESVQYTLEKAGRLKKLYGANVLYSINTPYPGTEQHDRAEAYGLNIVTKDYDFYSTDNAIMHTKYLSIDAIRVYYNQTRGFALEKSQKLEALVEDV